MIERQQEFDDENETIEDENMDAEDEEYVLSRSLPPEFDNPNRFVRRSQIKREKTYQKQEIHANLDEVGTEEYFEITNPALLERSNMLQCVNNENYSNKYVDHGCRKSENMPRFHTHTGLSFCDSQ